MSRIITQKKKNNHQILFLCVSKLNQFIKGWRKTRWGTGEHRAKEQSRGKTSKVSHQISHQSTLKCSRRSGGARKQSRRKHWGDEAIRAGSYCDVREASSPFPTWCSFVYSQPQRWGAARWLQRQFCAPERLGWCTNNIPRDLKVSSGHVQSRTYRFAAEGAGFLFNLEV